MTPYEEKQNILSGKQNWNDERLAQLDREIAAGGGGGGYGSGNYADIAKQMYELSKQFQAPAIAKMESTRPNITQIYGQQRTALEAEKEPLTKRYDQLLKDVTGVTRQAASTEFSARGIPLSSGLVEQTVGSRLAPQIGNIGLERESGLRNLQNQIGQVSSAELSAGSALDQAIAAIMSSSGQEGINSGLSIYQQQEQNRRDELQRQIQQQQLAQAALESARNAELEQQRINLASKPATTSYKETDYDKEARLRKELLAASGQGATLNQLVSQFGSGLSLSDIVGLYSGSSRYGTPQEEWARKLLGLSTTNGGLVL